MRKPDYARLDNAPKAIAPFGIALTNGNSNHAPMVVETLCALGRPEAVAPWLERYREAWCRARRRRKGLPRPNVR